MSHDVMISYASPDKQLAMAICAALEAHNIRCWIAPRDIPPGVRYAIAIVRAIEESRVFVLIFSDAAKRSGPVEAEVELAAFGRAGRETISFKIENVDLGDAFKLYLRRFQWLDAVGKSQEAAIQELVERVSAILWPPPSPPPPPGPAPRPRIRMWLIVVLIAAVAISGFILILVYHNSIFPKIQEAQTAPPLVSQNPDQLKSRVGNHQGTPPTSDSPNNPVTSTDSRQQMVQVPAGKFLMGSPESESDRDPDEKQNEVAIAVFLMDQAEVTNIAFQKFLIANASWQKRNVNRNHVDDRYLRDWEGTQFPTLQQSNYPVTRVSWYAAQAYCAWMKKRLPTEAEWEYAARAGSTTTYWWDDKWLSAHANGNLSRGPDPVGIEAHRNPWKLFDMLGNVKEWTSTVYKPYPYEANDGREDAESVSARSVRGGSWGDYPKYLRSAARTSKAPNSTDGVIGFRCARTQVN